MDIHLNHLNMNTNLSSKDITGRLQDFVEYYKKTEVNDLNPCKENFFKTSKSKIEDELYRLFLETHFQSPESATMFIELMNWNTLNNYGVSEIKRVCKNFFEQPNIKIGGHRKHFVCMTPSKRATYTSEVLTSYKAVIKKYKTQRNFFEIDGSPDFDDLYKRMLEINHFETRLPRFDHLEKVSRTFDFYCYPTRFYVEDATGPLDGVTYLILGKKFRTKKSRLKGIVLSKNFVKEWNSLVRTRYRLTDEETPDSTLRKMEQWTIETVRQSLPKSQRCNPGFVFDLETNICNWQKRK